MRHSDDVATFGARVTTMIVLAPLVFMGIVLFIVVGGVIVMLLWNWLLPSLFGWPEIGFWQALGLLALCRILFGGWGAYGRTRSRVRHRVAERWRERWSERLDRMTPEERDRLRRGMRGAAADEDEED